MADDIDYARVCRTGKRSYWSRKEARKQRRLLRKQKQSDGYRSAKGLSAYYCPICHGWHVGHLPQPVARGVASRQDIDVTHGGML